VRVVGTPEQRVRVDRFRPGQWDAPQVVVGGPEQPGQLADERGQVRGVGDRVHEGARAVTPAQLAGHRIWMPGYVAGTEWAAYYDELAAEFGITIDTVGPNFGTETVPNHLAGSEPAWWAAPNGLGSPGRLPWSVGAFWS